MKKIALAIVFAASTLAGCGQVDRTIAKYSGVAESCHDGVVYLQFVSGVTVKYATDGGIQRCDGSSSRPTSAAAATARSAVSAIPR